MGTLKGPIGGPTGAYTWAPLRSTVIGPPKMRPYNCLWARQGVMQPHATILIG